MIIDGAERCIEQDDIRKARGQLGLTADFLLVDATRWLQIDRGPELVQISLPDSLYVAAFESINGLRVYGVVSLQSAVDTEKFSG